MSNLALEASSYRPPEGLEDFGERYDEFGNKIVLYLELGKSAVVDILAVHREEGEEVVDALLWRAEPSPDKGVEALHHTPLFVPEAVGRAIFDKRAA